jgi:hypothetical protein
MEKETIVLYNHYNYGDIHLSRMLIKGLSEKFKIKFYHKLNHGLFEDMAEVEEHSLGNLKGVNSSRSDLGNKVVNTWIGQYGFIYLNSSKCKGCCMETYSLFLKDVLSFYNIEMKDPEYYLPSIDYKKLSDFDTITSSINGVISNYEKVIFISNGDVKSNQSTNFDFTPIIKNLASKFPNYIFLITNDIDNKLPNVVYTGNITNRKQDLLYLSYFSTLSNVIIGRSSGPYTFSLVKENLLDENKTLIGFTNIAAESYFYENKKCKFLWSNNYEINNIENIITSNI